MGHEILPADAARLPLRLVIAILYVGVGLAACRDRPTEPPPAPPAGGGLVLEVGPSLRADLRLLSQRFYAEAALDPLFARLEREGDEYCRMFYRLSRRDERRMAEFIGPGERYFETAPASKWSSRAGCWNFYQANDRQPWDDFDLVRALYPAARYDCYAIGLPQPYIMHNRLGCRSLTMVDFDWRIQDAHRRLLGRFQAGEISDAEALRTALAEIPFKWVARDNPPPLEREPSRYANLCQGARAACEAELLRFQANFAQLTRVRLSLSALHELTFGPGEPEVLRVVYLSNALSDGYTSYLEFHRFLANVTESLAEGHPLVLIQHAGARADFAIYAVSSANGSSRIVTRCHDFYRLGRPRQEDAVPATWLDLAAQPQEPPPGCHDLLRPP